MAGRGRGLVLDRLLSRSSRNEKTKEKEEESVKRNESIPLKSPEELLKQGKAHSDAPKSNFPLLASAASLTSPSNAGVGRGNQISKLMTPNQFLIPSPAKLSPESSSLLPQKLSPVVNVLNEELESEKNDQSILESNEDDCHIDDNSRPFDEDGEESDQEEDGEVEDENESDNDDRTGMVEIDVGNQDMPTDTVADGIVLDSNSDEKEVKKIDANGKVKNAEVDVVEQKQQTENTVQQQSALSTERVARVAPTVGSASPMLARLNVSASEQKKADYEWNQLKLERKIKKLLNGISDSTLDNVLKELPFLLRDKAFGDELHNCTVILTILFDKATQANDVHLFVPCLLKHLADQSYASVKASLPDVISKLSENLVKVVKSEKLISDANERFCNILGILFTFPVVYNESFHGLILPLVENCVKSWTHTRISKILLSGHRLDVAVAHVYALGYLMKRISLRLSDDEKPQAEMNSFIKSVRLSILNETIPRRLRSIYLELLLSDANEWPDDMFPHVHFNVHSQDLSLALENDNVADRQSGPAAQPEHTENKLGDGKLKGGDESVNCKVAATEPESNKPAEASMSSKGYTPSDPYSEITKMLGELNLSEELGRFKTNVIRDVSLHSHIESVKMLFKEADFPPGLSREVTWYLKNNGICKDTPFNRQQSGGGFRTSRGGATPNYKAQTFNRPDKSWRRADSPSSST